MDSLKNIWEIKQKTVTIFEVNSLRFLILMGDINIVSLDTDELVITSDRASVSFAFFHLI